MRTMGCMVHDVGAGVVNALCGTRADKGGGIYKMAKNRRKIQ